MKNATDDAEFTFKTKYFSYRQQQLFLKPLNFTKKLVQFVQDTHHHQQLEYFRDQTKHIYWRLNKSFSAIMITELQDIMY